MNPPTDTEPDYAYVVGIDFGTTFSGCCYGYARDTNLDDFQDITTWPRQRIVAYPKTPTVSLYKKDSTELAAWGDVARNATDKPNLQDVYLERFKLYLDESSASTLPLLPKGLTAVQVIADYLRAMHAYICETMQRGFAQNYEQQQFRYCLTVPAQWSDQAKAMMREASLLAGIIQRNDPVDRLTLISEPEAAALYCQKTCDQFKMSTGQRFMICDAGGGTVDLIVFEIEDIVSGANRSLKEVTKGSGDTCGSTFLDRNMEKLIRERFAHFGDVKQRCMDSMLNHFIERIKPQFDDGDDEYFIPIPFSLGYPNNDDPDHHIFDGTMVFGFEELRDKVFEPVVVRVLDLIQKQLDASAQRPVDAIFMVGGFGKSLYLQRRVREMFVPRVTYVSSPPRPEMAVVRGAVYFGMNPRLVTQRVSRRTYGLSSQILFDPQFDPPTHQVFVNGNWYCRERFSVFVNKGQAIDIDHCVTKKYMVTYPHKTETDLYAFDDDGPPPRLSSDPRIKLVARFPINMPAFPDLRYGEQVPMVIHMYFGRVEIKIEVVIREQRVTFTSRLDFTTGSSTPTPNSMNNLQPPMPNNPPIQFPSPVPSFTSTLPPYASPTMGNASPQPPMYLTSAFHKPNTLDPTSNFPKPNQAVDTPMMGYAQPPHQAVASPLTPSFPQSSTPGSPAQQQQQQNQGSPASGLRHLSLTPGSAPGSPSNLVKSGSTSNLVPNGTAPTFQDLTSNKTLPPPPPIGGGMYQHHSHSQGAIVSPEKHMLHRDEKTQLSVELKKKKGFFSKLKIR
ncbi:hypothetical protein BC940DRAFT_302289 [Gongronella butleri]|nr:hypothetical protein BC940DRAFT_302289 [Gongronella butleri]